MNGWASCSASTYHIIIFKNIANDIDKIRVSGYDYRSKITIHNYLLHLGACPTSLYISYVLCMY